MRRSPRAIAVVSVALLISTMQLLGAGPVRASHNLLDADTATLEGSVGHWVPWFSSTVARSTAEAHSGVASLKVDVTALHGWGAQLNNAPGFAASPGPMYLSFWGKLGSGSGLGATMHVDWHGISGSVFRTDTVKLPTLTGTWTQATNAVIAPPGTTSVTVEFTHPTGGPGDVIYLDDIVVSGTVNAVEYTTATLESSTGHWVPWFSTSLSLAGPPVNGGNFGLRIDVTAPFGWGVQLDNSPGFSATPGPKTIAFWGRSGVGALGATMQVDWRAADGTLLATDTVTIPSLEPWVGRHVSSNVTAPPGTARVTVEILHSSGQAGDYLFVDDILVADRPTS